MSIQSDILDFHLLNVILNLGTSVRLLHVPVPLSLLSATSSGVRQTRSFVIQKNFAPLNIFLTSLTMFLRSALNCTLHILVKKSLMS